MSSDLLRFDGARSRDPAVTEWFRAQRDELGRLARRWFDVARGCGEDVLELLHDERPTLIVGDVAFAYVDAYSAHVNVGFFRGAELDDPDGLLEGSGRLMRHIKLRREREIDAAAVERLVTAAYANIRRHIDLDGS